RRRRGVVPPSARRVRIQSAGRRWPLGMVWQVGVLTGWRRAGSGFRRATPRRRTMKHAFVIAGAAVLAISAPALADPPIALHSDITSYAVAAPGTPAATEVAQTQVPAYPPAPSIITAPNPPPPPQAETPPPVPSPSYVWEAGHWSWNGVQYIWQPGRYVEKP